MPSSAGLGEASPMDSKMEKFNQITAITQGYVNLKLEQWATKHVAKDLEVQLPPSGRKNIVRAKLRAEAEPIQIQLGSGAGGHQVWCCLHLKNGEMISHEDGEDESIPIDNWRIVFQADLGLEPVKMEDVPKHISNRLGRAGEYTVKKLRLNFATADVTNYSRASSQLPGLAVDDDAVLNAEREESLVKLLDIYIDTLKKHNEGGSECVFGYKVNFHLPKKAYPHAPALVPTTVAYQSSPYLTGNSEQPAAGLFEQSGDIADNNVLLYLEMTNHESSVATGLETRSNWVVPKTGEKLLDGSVAIAKQCFFDKYLLPKLAVINRDTAISAIQAKHDGFDPISIKFHFEIGKKFNERSDPIDYQWRTTNDPLVWTFKHSTYVESQKHTLGIFASLKCLTENKVQILPGTNEIRLTGLVTVLQVRNSNALNTHDSDWGCQWDAVLKLEPHKDGGLVIKTEATEPRHSSKGTMTQGDRGVVLAEYLRDLPTITSNSPAIETSSKSINGIFSDTWEFCFPSDGTFTPQNPRFNKEGDLLVELAHVQGDCN